MDTLTDPKRRALDAKPIAPSLFTLFVLRTANRTPLRDWCMTVLTATNTLRVTRLYDFARNLKHCPRQTGFWLWPAHAHSTLR